MKIIHAADVHLDDPLGGIRELANAPPAISNPTRAAFSALIDLCNTEAVDLLLICGDLFNANTKDWGLPRFVAREVSRLETAQMAFIKGNHDAETVFTNKLDFGPKSTLLTEANPTKRYDELGVAVHGISYTGRAAEAGLHTRYPAHLPGYINIGMLHTCASGSPTSAYASCSPKDLAQTAYNYWALGHVHSFNDFDLRDPWVVFPGCLQGRAIDETGLKGCVVIDAGPGGIRSVAFRPIPIVQWERIDVDVAYCKDRDDVAAEVERQIETRRNGTDGPAIIARVVLKGSVVPTDGCTADIIAQYAREETAFFQTIAATLERHGCYLESLRCVARRSEPLLLPEGFAREIAAEFERLRGSADARGQYGPALATAENLANLRKVLNEDDTWRIGTWSEGYSGFADARLIADLTDSAEELLLSTVAGD